MTTDWPTCDARMQMLEFEFDCVLPKGHEYDGQKMHRSSGEAVEWVIEVKPADECD